MPTVSQRFIDLLNAPMPVLRRVAAQNEVRVTHMSKWDLAQSLARLDRQTLEDETGQFLYAGSTALSWLRFAPRKEEVDEDDPDATYPIRGAVLSRDEVAAALRQHSEGDPFSETDRPDEITATPKLVVAREWEGSDYILTFAIAKRIGHVIHNFQDTAVYEDEFFNALLRPSAGSVEVRASAARADRLARTWLADFAETVGSRVLPVAITSQDYKGLHDELGARLDVFRGKTTTGTTVFDTREYTKADSVTDLLVEQEFTTATNDLEPVSMDLLFDVDGFGEVRMHVSVLNGSLFIRTAVPERIVRHVREVLERIKAGHVGQP
jgi:hypothetical protein